MEWSYDSGLQLLNKINAAVSIPANVSSNTLADLINSVSSFTNSVEIIKTPSTVEQVYSNELIRSLKNKSNHLSASSSSLTDFSINDLFKFSGVPLNYLVNLPSWFNSVRPSVESLINSDVVSSLQFSNHLILEDRKKEVASIELSRYFKFLNSNLKKYSIWGDNFEGTSFDVSLLDSPFHSPLTNSIVFPLNDLVSLDRVGSNDLVFNRANFFHYFSYELGHALMFNASFSNKELPTFLRDNPIRSGFNYSSSLKESVADFYSHQLFDVIDSSSRFKRKLGLSSDDLAYVKNYSFEKDLLNKYRTNFLSFAFYVASDYFVSSDEEKKKLLDSFAIPGFTFDYSLDLLRNDFVAYLGVSTVELDNSLSLDQFKETSLDLRRSLLSYLPYVATPVQDLYSKVMANDSCDLSELEFHDFVLSSGYLSVDGFNELSNVLLFNK